MKTKEVLGVLLILLGLSSCDTKDNEKFALKEIASSKNLWTGIAISGKDRIFVNFPRWSENVPISVGELKDGEIVPYPNIDFNNPTIGFNCIQSVFVDRNDILWVLETNNPMFMGVKDPGPALYKFDLSKDSLIKKYNFDSTTFLSNSYFNDVRIDEVKGVAYITDSGTGAIITLDLQTGECKRLLENHYSTKAERDYLIINSKKWSNTVHSDGIALSPDRAYLYYVALTGDHLYRIPTKELLNPDLSEAELEEHVEKVIKTGPADGMLFNEQGDLFMANLESNSVIKFNYPNKLQTVVKGSRIKWADSFSKDSQGNIYFTTSQIHLSEKERSDYRIYKIEEN